MQFGEPSNRSIDITIATSTQQLSCIITTFGEGFWKLTLALHAAMSQRGTFICVWQYQPDPLELIFERDMENIKLRVHYDERNQLVLRGTYEEVCLPFWRALQGLRSRYPEEELKDLIGKEFPFNEIDKLSAAVRSMKASER